MKQDQQQQSTLTHAMVDMLTARPGPHTACIAADSTQLLLTSANSMLKVLHTVQQAQHLTVGLPTFGARRLGQGMS
jgi:hypothetical protein